MKRGLFTVRQTGPVVTVESHCGRSLLELRQAIEDRIPPGDRFGETYDIGVLGTNIQHVREDAEAGLIPEPQTFDEFVEAVVKVYYENHGRVLEAARRNPAAFHALLSTLKS